MHSILGGVGRRQSLPGSCHLWDVLQWHLLRFTKLSLLGNFRLFLLGDVALGQKGKKSGVFCVVEGKASKIQKGLLLYE